MSDCSVCIYFNSFSPDDSESGGQCRRYSPIKCDRPGVNFAEWPIVKAGDWCGDFVDEDPEEDDGIT